MKKIILSLIALTLTSGTVLFAAQPKSGQTMQSMQGQNGQAPDCSQLSPDEQNFAAQLMDMTNKRMFCTQFTSQQRQQAMQMMGQPDASGNTMSADQAVTNVMGMGAMSPGAQSRTGAGGACPPRP